VARGGSFPAQVRQISWVGKDAEIYASILMLDLVVLVPLTADTMGTTKFLAAFSGLLTRQDSNNVLDITILLEV